MMMESISFCTLNLLWVNFKTINIYLIFYFICGYIILICKINYIKYIKCQEKEDYQINSIMIEIKLNN